MCFFIAPLWGAVARGIEAEPPKQTLTSARSARRAAAKVMERIARPREAGARPKNVATLRFKYEI